jgi:hypothetical protein
MIDELAKMEEILPRLGAYIEELNVLVQEITETRERTAQHIARADASNKGFAGRLAAARALAVELAPSYSNFRARDSVRDGSAGGIERISDPNRARWERRFG